VPFGSVKFIMLQLGLPSMMVYLYCYLIMVVCVTLDPGHTYDEHLVLAIKSGMTVFWPSCHVSCGSPLEAH
jgi:hypothetical protein